MKSGAAPALYGSTPNRFGDRRESSPESLEELPGRFTRIPDACQPAESLFERLLFPSVSDASGVPSAIMVPSLRMMIRGQSFSTTSSMWNRRESHSLGGESFDIS